MKTQTAQLRYLHIAPRKVRLLADTLKGLTAYEAEAQLLMRVSRARLPLLKLLRSAIANAIQNQKLQKEQLMVKMVRVDQGPMLKRALPRAQGRTTPIQKKMSHITLVLEEMASPRTSRFVIVPPPKKEKKEKEGKKVVPKKPDVQEKEKAGKPGFFKKVFRRKSMGE